MGQAEKSHDVSAAAPYAGRSVPGDWFVDPADPSAADRYRQDEATSLEEQATAFLAAHEALDDPDVAAAGEDLDPPVALFAPAPAPTWIGLPADPADYEGELGWQADALCAQTDPEAFFPEKGGSTRDAKKVCAGCAVRIQCLDYALANDERFGIWGGLSERERRRLRKRAV